MGEMSERVDPEPTLDEVFASAIRAYVAGELDGYSYHGDGSAIEALKRVDKEADGIASYARTHARFTDALARAASDAATPPPFIGPRCYYCGHSVQNPGDACGMCAGSKAEQQRRGSVGERDQP